MDTDIDMGIGTTRWHKQFLKIYNMIQQIEHRYDKSMTLQMKCMCILGFSQMTSQKSCRHWSKFYHS